MAKKNGTTETTELTMLEELCEAYTELEKVAEGRGYSELVLGSLRARRYQAELDLQGARGAKGLNPMTGAAS